MGYFSDQIITDAGMKMLADSIESGKKITFTHLDVGDGVYSITDIAGMKQQTALKSKRASAAVNSIHTSEDGIRIGSAISNEGLLSGYYIREVGVYASFPDGEETLIAISISTTSTASYLPAFDERVIEIPIMDHIAYSGDGNFTIEYRSDVYASLEDLKKLQEKVQELIDTQKIQIDKELSATSENPVENKAVHKKVSELQQSIEMCAKGAGLTFSVTDSGILTVTYDDGKGDA